MGSSARRKRQRNVWTAPNGDITLHSCKSTAAPCSPPRSLLCLPLRRRKRLGPSGQFGSSCPTRLAAPQTSSRDFSSPAGRQHSASLWWWITDQVRARCWEPRRLREPMTAIPSSSPTAHTPSSPQCRSVFPTTRLRISCRSQCSAPSP